MASIASKKNGKIIDESTAYRIIRRVEDMLWIGYNLSTIAEI
jgi:reverse gyrase